MKISDIAPGDGVVYIKNGTNEMEVGVYGGEIPDLVVNAKYRHKIYWSKVHDDSSQEMAEQVIEYRQNYLKILGGT